MVGNCCDFDREFAGGGRIATALRASQVIGGGMCLVALVILVVQSRRPHKPEDLYVNRVRAQSAAAEKEEKTLNESEDKTV